VKHQQSAIGPVSQLKLSKRIKVVAGIAAVFYVGTGFIDHLWEYNGHCGPYAPDIKRHPCGFGRYAKNFFSPFAVAGIYMVSLMIAAKCAKKSGWLEIIYCAWTHRTSRPSSVR
jgi:hypothetical protein